MHFVGGSAHLSTFPKFAATLGTCALTCVLLQYVQTTNVEDIFVHVCLNTNCNVEYILNMWI